MIDITLLRILKYRDDFYKVRGRVPVEALEPTAQVLLADYAKYFDKFPDHKKIHIPTFIPLFHAWHKDMKKDTQAAYTAVIKKIQIDVPEESKNAIFEDMMQLRLSSSLATLLNSFDDGEVSNFYGELSKLFDEHQHDVKMTGIDWVRDDIGDLLAVDERDDGLRYRMDVLNKHMRPARGGDFFIVGARPNKGKTTFLASELTFAAMQLPDGKTLSWLNNEGPGNRIKKRLYQAALGITTSKMIAQYKAGTLQKTYDDIMGVRDRIRVFDIHGMDIYAVERIIETNNVGIAVYDMIDKIRGFGDAARTDLGLEKMYDWARELCVKHDLVGWATSQISVEGDGMLFPTMPMLKDSKTGKQGACDVQLMIGANSDPGMQTVRGIGLVKNKLHREGQDEDPRAKVLFQPQIARFTDIPFEEADDEEDIDG